MRNKDRQQALDQGKTSIKAKCSHCSGGFISQQNLEDHEELHTLLTAPDKILVCSICNLKFIDEILHKTHMFSHGDKSLKNDFKKSRSKLLKHSNLIPESLTTESISSTFSVPDELTGQILVESNIVSDTAKLVTNINSYDISEHPDLILDASNIPLQPNGTDIYLNSHPNKSQRHDNEIQITKDHVQILKFENKIASLDLGCDKDATHDHQTDIAVLTGRANSSNCIEIMRDCSMKLGASAMHHNTDPAQDVKILSTGFKEVTNCSHQSATNIANISQNSLDIRNGSLLLKISESANKTSPATDVIFSHGDNINITGNCTDADTVIVEDPSFESPDDGTACALETSNTTDDAADECNLLLGPAALEQVDRSSLNSSVLLGSAALEQVDRSCLNSSVLLGSAALEQVDR